MSDSSHEPSGKLTAEQEQTKNQTVIYITVEALPWIDTLYLHINGKVRGYVSTRRTYDLVCGYKRQDLCRHLAVIGTESCLLEATALNREASIVEVKQQCIGYKVVAQLCS